ncbi:MAG: transposase [Bacillales bacterium]|nr:transposase [Bacillales bacterium]
MAKVWIEEGFPAKRVLKIACVQRSTYYYRLKNQLDIKINKGGRPIPGFSKTKCGKKVKDEDIKNLLLNLIKGEESIYGYKKLTKALRINSNLVINKKKVYRLCKELEILMPKREKKQKYPRRIARNREVTGCNQLWQLDIKYGYVATSRKFFYLASAIDVADRSIVGYHIGLKCDAKSITKMLQKAMMKRDIFNQKNTLIIRTDNGPQFCSKHFQEFCAGKVEHERIPPKSPNLNAYIESFHSVLERECFRINEFITFEQAFKTVENYISFYNERRFHGSLDYNSPLEHYERWKNGSVSNIKIAL